MQGSTVSAGTGLGSRLDSRFLRLWLKVKKFSTVPSRFLGYVTRPRQSTFLSLSIRDKPHTYARDFVFGSNPELTELKLAGRALTKTTPWHKRVPAEDRSIIPSKLIGMKSQCRQMKAVLAKRPTASCLHPSSRTAAANHSTKITSPHPRNLQLNYRLTFSITSVTWSGNRSARFFVCFCLFVF